MSKASGAFGQIVIWLLVVVLVAGVAFVALFFVMRSQGATYYIEYDGNRYLGGTNGGVFDCVGGNTYEFSVKSLAGGEVDFAAKVMASGETTVRFSFGDELHTLYNGNDELDDYSEVFGLDKNADGFSLTLPDNFTVEQAIETKYGGDVVLQDDISEKVSCFMSVVEVGESAVNIRLVLYNMTITFDPPQIIF